MARRIDQDPETRKKARSAFVRSAVASYLAAKRRRETDAALRAAYADSADDMAAEVTELMDAAAAARAVAVRPALPSAPIQLAGST